MPAISRLGRRREVALAPVPNVNWHGPAAQSLTIAATTGGVSKNKNWLVFLRRGLGSELEAKTRQPAVGRG